MLIEENIVFVFSILSAASPLWGAPASASGSGACSPAGIGWWLARTLEGSVPLGYILGWRTRGERSGRRVGAVNDRAQRVSEDVHAQGRHEERTKM